MTGYLGLFVSSFLAATLLPFYSEILLAGLAQAGYSFWWLLFVSTAGNTLGAAVNWAIGRYLEHYKHHRWFPFKEGKLDYAQRWFNRFGVWSLLMAWLPIGGDALTFIAGLLRVSFPVFFILTAIGKGARYAVVLLAMQQF
ncbi:MAG: YqaA family protein [Halomonas sp.]|nr:YqaA family protein [Halomonas sp.]